MLDYESLAFRKDRAVCQYDGKTARAKGIVYPLPKNVEAVRTLMNSFGMNLAPVTVFDQCVQGFDDQGRVLGVKGRWDDLPSQLSSHSVKESVRYDRELGSKQVSFEVPVAGVVVAPTPKFEFGSPHLFTVFCEYNNGSVDWTMHTKKINHEQPNMKVQKAKQSLTENLRELVIDLLRPCYISHIGISRSRPLTSLRTDHGKAGRMVDDMPGWITPFDLFSIPSTDTSGRRCSTLFYVCPRSLTLSHLHFFP